MARMRLRFTDYFLLSAFAALMGAFAYVLSTSASAGTVPPRACILWEGESTARRWEAAAAQVSWNGGSVNVYAARGLAGRRLLMLSGDVLVENGACRPAGPPVTRLP